MAAAETHSWAYDWINSLNADAIKKFKKKVKIIKLKPETLTAFRKTTKNYLDDLKTKHPDVKKVLDSQEMFFDDYAEWRDARSDVTPWPYETYISGKTTE